MTSISIYASAERAMAQELVNLAGPRLESFAYWPIPNTAILIDVK
jgi:hypothetical protein